MLPCRLNSGTYKRTQAFHTCLVTRLPTPTPTDRRKHLLNLFDFAKVWTGLNDHCFSRIG
jgi:hypothetical protein